MRHCTEHYISGRWVAASGQDLDVVNPATEEIAGTVRLGDAADVDLAVSAARGAFAAYSRSTTAEREDLLSSIISVYQRRQLEVADAITEEMGAPVWLARELQAPIGLWHLQTALEVLRTYTFESLRDGTLISLEPIGVCALITPWNWPINQIACKVAPALAVGCTMVLKPSELAPFSARIWAEVLDEAGVPPGVFNLLNGDGATVGSGLAKSPSVDLVSFTGSTRAGVAVANDAAATVKRVHQELGGKSANIILSDASFHSAVEEGVKAVMLNSGQSCNAPTRMLVLVERMDEAKAIAGAAAASVQVGVANSHASLGPVASGSQWQRVQQYIRLGLDEGATLVSGGLGRPEGLETGFFVKPTVFADVRNDMAISQEEIFGPVLSILGYADEDEAISIANDTAYGLAAYVQSESKERARRVASQLRAGQVLLNYSAPDFMAPFGGYKQSGNGREWGDHAFAEYLETKATVGWA